jgi:predicted nucleic acid-binding protein
LTLIDSSVWIDYLSSSPGPAGAELRRLIVEGEPVALTGIIVSEVLQGLAREIEEVERFLAMWEVIEPRGLSTYRAAAGISRLARTRTRGISLTTIDSLIAAIALGQDVALFSLDKDFAHISKLTGLRLYQIPQQR